jgi:hypothetical protein
MNGMPQRKQPKRKSEPMDTDLSVAIVSCGRDDTLRKCIRSIKSKTKTPYKLVILDVAKIFNKNHEPNAWIKKQADKYVEYDKPLGIGAGYQMVADLCDTKYIFHIDDDLYLSKDSVIDNEYKYIKEHPEVGIVSCCWFDKLYNGYRECAMFWLEGWSSKNQRLSFKKLVVPFQLASDQAWGEAMNVVKSDEALHSMIVNKELVYNKGIKWDSDLPSKGDREAFFYHCKKEGVDIRVLTDNIVIHEPTYYEHGSSTYTTKGADSKEYFYKKYGYWPITFWDQPQLRAGPDGRPVKINQEGKIL